MKSLYVMLLINDIENLGLGSPNGNCSEPIIAPLVAVSTTTLPPYTGSLTTTYLPEDFIASVKYAEPSVRT